MLARATTVGCVRVSVSDCKSRVVRTRAIAATPAPVSRWRGAVEMRVAHQAVYHDPKHPSALVLPRYQP
jgi:hypothetical protein